MNELPAKITVQLMTTGFKILSFGFKQEQDPVEVDVAASVRNSILTSDVLSLATSSFMTDFARELGKEVTITGFNPDSIVFNFSDLTTKKVPVRLDLKVSFEKQYDTTGSPVLKPAEIDVSGPPSVIEHLNYVVTEPVTLTQLKSNVKKKVGLIRNRLLSYSQDEIEFNLPVEKFTEGSAEVEIHPVNVAEGFSLKTFPDKVKVRYLVSLSEYSKVTESMFDAVVDAGELTKKTSLKLPVKIMTSPAFVKVIMLEPEKVDYILRKQ